MQRRALVTGVTGFVARALVVRLLKSGWQVRGTTRGEGGHDPELRDVEVVTTGPLGPNTDWSRAVNGVTAVFHLASRVHRSNEYGTDAESAYRIENTEGSISLARAAARAGAERFVFTSTVKVNGGERQSPYTEADAPAPVDAYGDSKLRAEQGLRYVEADTGMAAFVLRPPLVYGPGVRANFLSLVRLVDRGWPMPFGGVANSRSLIAVENLADALACCATAHGPGSTFLVSDGVDVSTPQLMRQLGAALGRPARLFNVPTALMGVTLRACGLGGVAARLLGTLRVDSSAIRQRLGWRPRVTMEEGLSSLAEWYRATADGEKCR